MLYAHQQKIISDDPKRCGIFLQTGGGKTRTCLHLARGKTLIIMPKTQFQDENWHREWLKLREEGLDLPMPTYISKEMFKRDHEYLSAYDTVVIDEAHTVSGVTPAIRHRNRVAIPKASQIFEAVYMYLKRTKPERIYLATATPARNPMAVWALGALLGREHNWHEWRERYYHRLNMPGREVWQPRKDKVSRDMLANAVNALGYVGKMDDWFDVPPQIDKYIHCPLTRDEEKVIEELPLEYPDPLALIGKTHEAEQGKAKLEAIEDLLEEHAKVLVFARYRAQIDRIAEYFESAHDVFVITGDTKDRKSMIEKAEKAENGVIVVQAQIATGFELPSVHCVIFASMSYSHVDHVQAKGRVLRVNKLGKKLYVYLHSGEVDDAIIKCINSHTDFSEMVYAKARSKIPTEVQPLRPGAEAQGML